MAIEFRCTKCNKLLRTADDTAGKHAKCPECGEILLIPAAGTPPAAPASPASPFAGSGGFAPPPGGPVGGSPFGAGEQPQYQPDTGNPYQSPSPFAPLPTLPVGAGEIRPTIIDFNDVIGRTWTLFKENYTAALLGWILIILISNAVSYGLSFGGLMIGQFVLKSPALGQILNFVGSIAANFFYCWLFLGQNIYFLKVVRGQNAQVSDLFTGGPFYVNGLIAIILWILAYIGGILLLIVPGIIWGLMFSQCYFFVIDRNADAMQSLSLSKQFMAGNKMTLFLIWLVCGLVGALVVICTCLLGAFAVGPFMSLLGPVVYLSLTGQPTVDQVRARMGIQ
jgi:uncharacterized membrane protein